MVVEVADALVLEGNEATQREIVGSHPTKKKYGKLPKKVLKAEREKLKREKLNDHFSRLANVLDLCEENNGKASLLSETIRLVNDSISQIQSLRKENATLLSESQYMTVEKNELRDENTALEEQIKKLQSDIEERLAQSKPDLNVNPAECWQADIASQFMQSHLQQLPYIDPSKQQSPVLGPLYVIPVAPDLQGIKKVDAVSNPPVEVSKPHARYPTAADSWPLQLLSKQTETTT